MSDSPAFRPIRRPVILGVVGLMMLVSACGGGNDVARLTNEPIPLEDLQNDDAIGSDVDIDFTTFDGSTSNFTAYAGTPLVVNFFSRTCAPCVTEMPEFEAVFQAFDGAVAFVGISTDARFDDAELIVEQTASPTTSAGIRTPTCSNGSAGSPCRPPCSSTPLAWFVKPGRVCSPPPS